MQFGRNPPRLGGKRRCDLIRAQIPSYTSLRGEATGRCRKAWLRPIHFSILPSSDVVPFAAETINVLAWIVLTEGTSAGLSTMQRSRTPHPSSRVGRAALTSVSQRVGSPGRRFMPWWHRWRDDWSYHRCRCQCHLACGLGISTMELAAEWCRTASQRLNAGAGYPSRVRAIKGRRRCREALPSFGDGVSRGHPKTLRRAVLVSACLPCSRRGPAWSTALAP